MDLFEREAGRGGADFSMGFRGKRDSLNATPLGRRNSSASRPHNARAVLIGKVYRFRQRDGTDYSVNRPASVAFHLDLIRVADGRVVWTGNFDETQHALSEDLFRLGAFLERKGRWVTAEDLAVYGLRRTLETMPPL